MLLVMLIFLILANTWLIVEKLPSILLDKKVIAVSSKLQFNEFPTQNFLN